MKRYRTAYCPLYLLLHGASRDTVGATAVLPSASHTCRVVCRYRYIYTFAIFLLLQESLQGKL